MKRVFLTLCVLLSFTLFLSARGRKQESRDGTGREGVRVLTTIFPPYDFVREIGGGTVNLSMLLPPGAESHSFEPSPRDIINIQNSDIFIYNGGESDVWVDRILSSMDRGNKKIIRLMDCVDVVEEEIVEGMQEEEEEEDGEGEAEYDEHVWTSPANAKRIVLKISDVLCEADRANAPLYRDNTAAYLEKLDELDRAFRETLSRGTRKTLVFGDRFPFRYFADAYGLSYFAAFPGCSTETEASAATIAFLINKVRQEKIPVVFHIELSNEKIADTICQETGAKKGLFHAAHNVSKREFESGATYLGIMTKNVEILREALR
ncbi:MAG: metal ABC transporter substrate-binding protein [Treponema sp.]|jgi:zinc transport system substrate-binding protein|nr:metal ABC transporter substrate-binding protein [Treponema sp.]